MVQPPPSRTIRSLPTPRCPRLSLPLTHPHRAAARASLAIGLPQHVADTWGAKTRLARIPSRPRPRTFKTPIFLPEPLCTQDGIVENGRRYDINFYHSPDRPGSDNRVGVAVTIGLSSVSEVGTVVLYGRTDCCLEHLEHAAVFGIDADDPGRRVPCGDPISRHETDTDRRTIGYPIGGVLQARNLTQVVVVRTCPPRVRFSHLILDISYIDGSHADPNTIIISAVEMEAFAPLSPCPDIPCVREVSGSGPGGYMASSSRVLQESRDGCSHHYVYAGPPQVEALRVCNPPCDIVGAFGSTTFTCACPSWSTRIANAAVESKPPLLLRDGTFVLQNLEAFTGEASNRHSTTSTSTTSTTGLPDHDGGCIVEEGQRSVIQTLQGLHLRTEGLWDAYAHGRGIFRIVDPPTGYNFNCSLVRDDYAFACSLESSLDLMESMEGFVAAVTLDISFSGTFVAGSASNFAAAIDVWNNSYSCAVGSPGSCWIRHDRLTCADVVQLSGTVQGKRATSLSRPL